MVARPRGQTQGSALTLTIVEIKLNHYPAVFFVYTSAQVLQNAEIARAGLFCHPS